MQNGSAAAICKAPSANFPEVVLDRLRDISGIQSQAHDRLRQVLDRNHGPSPTSSGEVASPAGPGSMFSSVHGMLSVLWDQAIELRTLAETVNETR